MAVFCKIYKLLIYLRAGYMYCSVRGIKVPCICGEKISLVTRLCLKTSHCSCFLYRWIAFWKDKSFFNRNTCVQQEKISTVGAALGAVFIKKTQSNYPISLFSRTGILSRNSKIALIITPKLLTCCKKAFFLASSEKYFCNKRNKKWARCTIDDRGCLAGGKARSLRCCVTFHLHGRFQVLERLPSIMEI